MTRDDLKEATGLVAQEYRWQMLIATTSDYAEITKARDNLRPIQKRLLELGVAE